MATLMRPVSSETTTAMASELWEMPMAARCRNPSSFGISKLCETGKIHPAALIRFLEITKAPSCKGEFLKKMFSIKRWLIFASIRSPVATMSSKGILRSITIKAPTLSFAMLIHAKTIGMIVSLSSSRFTVRTVRMEESRPHLTCGRSGIPERATPALRFPWTKD